MRINSPLLDGLWRAVTGRVPDGQTAFEADPPADASSFVLRFLYPRVYEESLRWYISKQHENTGDSPKDQYGCALVQAASIGRLSVVQLLLSVMDLPADVHIDHALTRAVANDHMDCALFLHPHWRPGPDELDSMLYHVIDTGHFDMFKWLFEAVMSHQLHHTITAEEFLRCASMHGRDAMVDWLLKRCNPPFEDEVLQRAHMLGFTSLLPDTLQRLASHQLGPDIIRINSTIDRAIREENIDALRRLIALRPRAWLNPFAAQSLFVSLTSVQDVAVLQVLQECGLFDDTQNYSVTLSGLVRSFRADLLEFMVQAWPMITWDMKEALYVAAAVGDARVLRLVVDLTSKHDSADCVDELKLLNAEGARALSSQMPESILREHFSSIFHRAMINGHLATVAMICGHPSTMAYRVEMLRAAVRVRQMAVVKCILQSLCTTGSPIDSAVLYTAMEYCSAAPDIRAMLCAHCAVYPVVDISVARQAFRNATIGGCFDLCDVLLPLLREPPCFSAAHFRTLAKSLAVALAGSSEWFMSSALEVFSWDFLVEMDKGLVAAVSSGHLKQVELLLDAGATASLQTLLSQTDDAAIIALLTSRLSKPSAV